MFSIPARVFKTTQIATKLFSTNTPAFQKLYVGNLAWTTNEDTLRELFSKHGEVVDAFIVRDRLSGKSRGFGFVQFENQETALAAKQALDGAENNGRTLRVNEADEKPPRAPHPY